MASPTVRRVILTGAVAAITATGAIYGGQLKDTQNAVKASATVLILIHRWLMTKLRHMCFD